MAFFNALSDFLFHAKPFCERTLYGSLLRGKLLFTVTYDCIHYDGKRKDRLTAVL